MAIAVGEHTEAIDETIRRVAIRRLGVIDASIERWSENFRQSDSYAGVWFSLFVREWPGDGWRLVGRRRTKVELLELVGTIDPRHINGKRL